MKVLKVVRTSDLGDLRFDEKAAAYRQPGVLVWTNTSESGFGRHAFTAGGNYGHAASVVEALEIAKGWKDRHAAAIEKIIAACARYGFYLSPKKALNEYLKHDGVFQMPHPNYIAELVGKMENILSVLMHREIWYQHGRGLPLRSLARHEANEQGYAWSGIFARMSFGHVYGVSEDLATFIEKLPRLKGYELSIENPLFKEKSIATSVAE